MTFDTLTTAQLKSAIQIREQIDSLQEKLAALLGGEKPAAVTKKKVGRTKGKRKMSTEGRAAIAAAQKSTVGEEEISKIGWLPTSLER